MTWDHPLAAVAARNCQKHATTLPALMGGVACSDCWDDALIADFLFAVENDLPLELEVDPSYVDEIAVERSVRRALGTDDQADTEALTALERTEVRRRLSEIRTRRNRGYQFVCSHAAAARREVQR
jgi:hypothetical protein